MIVMAGVPLLTILALAAGLWPWTSRYDARPTVRLLACLVLTSLLVVLSQVALGLLGVLSTGPLLLLAWLTAIVLGVTGYLARVPHLPVARSRRVGALERLYARLGLAPPTWQGLALGALAVLAYLGLFAVGTLIPPYGWDTLTYHLTDIFHAAQTHSLALFSYPGRSFYYPQVGEFHSLWAFLLAGGGDQAWRVTGIGLLWLSLTAGVAVRAACEALSFRRCLPWIVPATMLTPLFMIQPLSGYVDGVFAALFLAAFAFAILAAVEGRFAHLGLCAVASGLAIGAKVSFIYYCLPILLVLASAAAWREVGARDWKRVAARAALLLALFSAGSGYWLGRNLVTTGNPLYPTEVKVAGVTLLPGPRGINPSKRQESWFVSGTSGWIRYPFYETFNQRPEYTLENGFGPLFAAGFVGTAVGLVLAARRRSWVLFRSLWALPLTVVPWLTISPYQEPRYVMQCAGFALIALGAIVEEIGGPKRSPGARAPARYDAPMWIAGAAVVAGIVFGAAGGLAGAPSGLDDAVRLRKAGEWTPERFYRMQYGTAGDAFNWISENSRNGKTVTFTNASFIAPLFGWHGRNHVVFVPTAESLPIGNAPRARTYASWRRMLLESGAEWIVVWVPWWGEEGAKRTESWIAGHPEGFEMIREFGAPEQVRARVYRLVFGEAERAALKAPQRGPDFGALDSPDAWSVEYQTGTRASLSPVSGGGVRIDYEFKTGGNDYADLRADLEEGDWSSSADLSFDLAAEPAPTFVFVYLKDRGAKLWSRYRIPLADASSARKRIFLDLRHPERQSSGFRLTDVAEVHLVVDDVEDKGTGKGRLEVAGFRLEPTRRGEGVQ